MISESFDMEVKIKFKMIVLMSHLSLIKHITLHIYISIYISIYLDRYLDI